MRKLLILLLSVLTLSSCAQYSSTKTETGAITLKGFGKFGGPTDNVSVRRFNGSVTSYYAYDAYFSKVNNNKAAVGISILNDSLSSTDGKVQAAHIVFRNDSLLVLNRKLYGQNLIRILGKKYFALPQYLKVIINRNKLEIFSGKRADGTKLSKVWEKDSVFLGWQHRTPNLLFPVFGNVASADVSEVKYTSIGNPPIPVIPGDTITPPDTTTLVAFGEIPSINFTDPAMLNQIDFTQISDFDVPKHSNGEYKFKNLLVGPNFRTQTTAQNVLKKGYTMIDWGVMKVGTERQNPTYDPFAYDVNFVSTLAQQERTISITTDPSLNVSGFNGTAEEVNSVYYSQYVSEITGGLKLNISKFFRGADTVTTTNFVTLDIENGIRNLPIEDFANRIIAIYDAIKKGVHPNTKVSLIYQSTPLPDVGLGVDSTIYTASPVNFWNQTTTWTDNAVDKSFPSTLIGKKLSDLSYILGIVEYYCFYEATLPEGHILINKLNDSLRDASGNNISVLSHFNMSQPSYLHFATHLNASLEGNFRLIGDKPILFQTSIFNQGGGGYYYADYGSAWPTQPQNTIIKQFYDEYVYPIDTRIVEAMQLNSLFLGAWYYAWMDTGVITEADRSLGEIHTITTRRRDYKGMTAIQAGMKRLSAIKTPIDGVQVSVADLIDGSEIYTRENTQVNYLTVPGFSGVKSVKGTDFKKHKLSVVRCIVNEAKGLIAILAYQPYGVEQSEVDVYYNNIYQYRIQIPSGQNKIYIAKLKTY